METRIRKYDSGFLELQVSAGNEQARLLILPDTGTVVARETRVTYFNPGEDTNEIVVKREADKKYMHDCPYTLARFFGILVEEVEKDKTIEYKTISHEIED